MRDFVVRLEELGMDDVEMVGGKNASLGEMISNLANLGVTVPGGFATTSAAYRDFLSIGGLDTKIAGILEKLDVDDIDALDEGADLLVIGRAVTLADDPPAAAAALFAGLY